MKIYTRTRIRITQQVWSLTLRTATLGPMYVCHLIIEMIQQNAMIYVNHQGQNVVLKKDKKVVMYKS